MEIDLARIREPLARTPSDHTIEATSQNNNSGNGCDSDMDDEDGEPIISFRKRNRSRKHILLADSEDEDGVQGVENDTDTQPIIDPGYMSDGRVRHESDSTYLTPTSNIKRKGKIVAPSLSSDSETDDRSESNDHGSKTKRVTKRKVQNEDKRGELSIDVDSKMDMIESENADDSQEKNCQKAKSFLTNNDLFDAENSAGSGNSSGEDSCSLSAIKKSVKAKVAKPQKPKKLSKDGLKQLHSESQRIVRESRVSLPYHVPKQKSVEDFLNRRKSTPSSLRPSSREITCLLQTDMRLRMEAKKLSTASGKPETSSCSQLENVIVDNSAEPTKQIDDTPDTLPSGSVAPSIDESDFCGTTDDTERIDKTASIADIAEDLSDSAATDCAPMDNFQGSSPSLEMKRTISSEEASSFDCQTPLLREKKLISRLQSCSNLNVNDTPKLGGGTPNSIILFDDENDMNKSSVDVRGGWRGVDNLIHRFMHHSSTKRKRESKQTVELSVLKLDLTSSGEEQLSSEKVNVTVGRDGDEIPEGLPPGERLRLFKELQKSKLLLQRSEVRKQRALLKAEENEEGLEDESEEEILSEPTESEEEESEEELEEDCPLPKDKKRQKSLFIDDEAEESDADDAGMDERDSNGETDDDEDADVQAAPPGSFAVTGELEPLPLRLRLQLGTESETSQPNSQIASGVARPDLSRADTIQLFPSQEPGTRKSAEAIGLERSVESNANGVADRSFELLGSIIPGYQPQKKQGCVVSEDHDDSDLFTQLSFCAKAPGPTGEDCSSEEDSIDLSASRASQFDESISRSSASTKLLKQRLGFENTQKIQSQTNNDELYDLCSGKWSDSTVPLRVSGLGDTALPSGTQDNMEELFGLCSGTFSGATFAETSNSQPTVNCEKRAANSEGRMSLFGINSSVFSADEASMSSTNSDTRIIRRRISNKTKRVLSDTEDDESENDGFSDDCDSGEEELPKKRTNVRDFFEKEAELSGSDVPSDEDDELAEEDDILEEELGDQDILLSEDELKEQVGKVHHKMLMDEDQKQLRLYKEVYLEDGELHSDTKGRSRNFRWQTIDADSQDDYPHRNSDSEIEDDEGKEEEQIEMRLKRHERQKWLNESKKSLKGNSDDEDENILPLVHKVQVNSRNNSQNLMNSGKKSENTLKARPKLVSLRGSFLSRSKVDLDKLADKTKGTSDLSKKSGPRNSRSFVFSVLSPTKEQRPASPVPQSSNVSKSAVRVVKKPRLEKFSSLPASNTINANSIFHKF